MGAGNAPENGSASLTPTADAHILLTPFVDENMKGGKREFVRMPETEFEEILARAAEQGARRALADVGLDGHDAATDIRDLRTLLAAIREARRTALQTFVRLLVTATLLALMAGMAVRMKLFG